MKNICFLNGDMSRSGGTERVTSIIANELSKKIELFNVHVLSTVNESGESFFELDNSIIQNRILSNSNLDFKREYFNVNKGIRKYIRKNKIDILIDVDVISGLFSIPATRFTKTKLISWEHFHFYEENGSKLRALSRKLAGKFSDYIITLTEKDKNNYIKNLKVDKKIDFIYNPIIENINGSCNIDSKQIISVGRLTSQKGFDMLCDVANLVLHKNPNWKWIILGEGEDRELIEKKIAYYNLENKLILKGNVAKVEGYYKNSSIYVMTSRFEGLPMTLLEAKGYGLPIVSFDCLTGPSDIVTNNVNGYLIEPNNIEKMCKEINGLIENNEKREQFSGKSDYDIDKFKLNSIVEKWIKILEEI